MYSAVIEEIDGVDNGIDSATGEKNYKVTTTVSSRISRLRPAWNEEYTTEKEIECFRLAMGIMMEELAYHLHEQVEVLLPARQIVEHVRDDGECKEQAVNVTSEPILVLENYCPYLEHLYEIEKERGMEGYFKFVIFQGSDQGWRVKAVNISIESFALRQQLLPHSLGLRDEELCQSCGIEGCVFVHINGFMGVNKTKEGALEMARKSL